MGIKSINTLVGLITKANRVMETATSAMANREKSAKGVTFCGPSKSFPVPDCKHVAVAKAYLGKSKFSTSTKKKIEVCIDKRAKMLGYEPTEKAKTNREYPIYIELSYEQKQLYMSEVFASTRLLVDESINNPDMYLNEIDIIV